MKSLRDIILPLIDDLRTGKKSIEVSELWGASKALFLFGLQREAGRPLIVVTASQEAAEALAEDLAFFTQKLSPEEAGNEKHEILLFPAWGVLPFEADSPDSRTFLERMRFLYSLISGANGIYVAPVRSLVQQLPPPYAARLNWALCRPRSGFLRSRLRAFRGKRSAFQRPALKTINPSIMYFPHSSTSLLYVSTAT